jgi:hypothetical protein
MLEIPCEPPTVQECETCGHPADVVLTLPDGTLAAACWRDRIDLPVAVPGTRRAERRFGRWCTGRIAVADLAGGDLRLPCEACGGPGDVVWEVRTDDAHWETVSCLGCLPPAVPTHSGVTTRAHLEWDAAAGAWRSRPARWWPSGSAPSKGRRTVRKAS